MTLEQLALRESERRQILASTDTKHSAPLDRTEVQPDSSFQLKKATEMPLSVDQCPGKCLHDGKERDLVVQTVKKPHQTDAGATEDDKRARSQGVGSRRRTNAKKFLREKGPRIAGAAATVAMFVFNVVSCCG